MTNQEPKFDGFRAVHYTICFVAACLMISVLGMSCAWEQVHTPTVERLTTSTDTTIPPQDVKP